MKMVALTRLFSDAARILRRVAKGEGFILLYRGRRVARLEPIGSDPFLAIGRRALPSPKGKTAYQDIDRIAYRHD